MSSRPALPPAPAVARPPRPPARDRARADRHRLGPLRARRGPARPHGLLVPLPLLVPLRGRGDRERPGHRRGAARRQPRRRAPARRVDDRQGDPGGAPAPAQAPPHRRALLQGLSVLLHVRGQDRRRPRPPGQRPAPAARRAAARARLPRGRQGDGQALQGPLQAAPLRPRRLRRGGGEGRRPDRARRDRRRGGGDAHVRPGRAAQAAHRPHLLPGHAVVPALRAARRRLPAGEVQAPLPRARAHRPDRGPAPRPGPGRRRRDPRPHPGRARRHARPPQVRLDGR